MYKNSIIFWEQIIDLDKILFYTINFVMAEQIYMLTFKSFICAFSFFWSAISY